MRGLPARSTPMYAAATATLRSCRTVSVENVCPSSAAAAAATFAVSAPPA
jgi:hypothetical protein